MTHVLSMATFQVSHPVILFVLVKTSDFLIHVLSQRAQDDRTEHGEGADGDQQLPFFQRAVPGNVMAAVTS